MSHRLSFALLAVIVSIFGSLAFRHINTQGILYHDAGVYLFEAKFLQEGVDIILQRKISREPGFWTEIKQQTEGVPIYSGKPVWSLILAAGGWFFGFHDALSAKITAAMGLLILILVFILSRTYT